MSSIDYRTIIERTLPELAAELSKLIKPIGQNHDFEMRVKHHGHYTKHVYLAPVPWQESWRKQVDYTKPFHRKVSASANGHEYTYNPVRLAGVTRPPGTTPDIVDECYITFRNIRVVDIIDQRFGPLDTIPTGPSVSAVKKYPNDSPEPATKTLGLSETSWTEWGKDWEAAVSSELSQTIKAGSELYGVESETSLKISAGYSQSGSKAGGKERSSSDETTTTVRPFSILEVVQSQQPVKLSQDIIVTGKLECEIEWGLLRCFDETSTGLSKMLDVFRGLGSDNEMLTEWFSNPDHCPTEDQLAAIQVPTVTINLGISDVPAEKFEVRFRQRPIKEAEEKS